MTPTPGNDITDLALQVLALCDAMALINIRLERIEHHVLGTDHPDPDYPVQRKGVSYEMPEVLERLDKLTRAVYGPSFMRGA